MLHEACDVLGRDLDTDGRLERCESQQPQVFIEVAKRRRQGTASMPASSARVIKVVTATSPAGSSSRATYNRCRVSGNWMAARCAADSAAAIGMFGRTQRSDSMVLDAFAGRHHRARSPKRTADPRRLPIARLGVSTGALPKVASLKPPGSSQVRCAPVSSPLRSVTAAMIAGQISVRECSSGRKKQRG